MKRSACIKNLHDNFQVTD